MNLLFSNDKRGQFPDSWYAATADAPAPCAPLTQRIKADVCIIGGGYTGLSAALHLAESGAQVVLLEAHRVGFGASGRNGGQLGSGQRQDQITLEKMVGRDEAKRLWALGQDAKDLVKGLIQRHGIDCALRPGVAAAGRTPQDMAELHGYAEHLSRHYDYDAVDCFDKAGFFEICPSPDYHGGTVDTDAAHLHPLRLAFGLARAAQSAGAQIFERSHVHSITQGPRPIVRTDAGQVEAETIILAANGYLGGLNRKVASRVMPINNFIVASEPLGPRTQEVLRRDIAVADTRFVVNYFRLSEDGRLLFGGGESYGYRFPRDIRAVVRKPLLKVFPHLSDLRFDYAWGGTLAITMKRLPYVARVAPNILSASGYSGHGVGNAVQAGKLMADALRGQADGFDTMARIPSMPFPGGPAFRTPLLATAMTWYALRDRLGG